MAAYFRAGNSYPAKNIGKHLRKFENHFILRSSNGAFQVAQLGQNGEIPIETSLNP